MVTKIDLNEPAFLHAFGAPPAELIKSEFLFGGAKDDVVAKFLENVEPCLVTLVAECDEVQDKVGTFRYLLGALIKDPEANQAAYYSKNQKSFANNSIYTLGNIRLKGLEHDSGLLISCSKFYGVFSRNPIPGTPIFRLKRATLDELLHHYTTHARRPGVMRFF
jgi:hypothetical protein